MHNFRRSLALLILGVMTLSRLSVAGAATDMERQWIQPGQAGVVPLSSYVLGDSIGYGLQLAGLADALQAKLGGSARISYDAGRSMTSPGIQIKKTAFESIELDKAYIATASVIILVFGTNQVEPSFADSQRQLMQQLKKLAPNAQYFWVDIGATISTQAAGWSARNKLIYDNAAPLGYTVISRYKTIFGPSADPLNITPGRVFPGWVTEPGYGGEGNIHGADAELSKSIVGVVSTTLDNARVFGGQGPLSSYVLGDSIIQGLPAAGLTVAMQARLGGNVKFSHDAGRSITSPGTQIKKTALESLDVDRDYIAQSSVIIVVLGTNQTESSFADSQQQLMRKFKSIAPNARYFWVDIGATMSTQAAGWSARNKIIYANAAPLGYTVISRYQAIFGAAADPLNIMPGQLFPGLTTEPGYDGDGNIHGANSELSQAIVQALSVAMASARPRVRRNRDATLTLIGQ
jgi:hypothetical protein